MTPSLRDYDHLSDIELQCEGDTIRAHRSILAARCRFFEAMLGGSFAESGQQTVKIDSMSAETLKHVLVYLYTGRVGDAISPPELVPSLEISSFPLLLLYSFLSLIVAD